MRRVTGRCCLTGVQVYLTTEMAHGVNHDINDDATATLPPTASPHLELYLPNWVGAGLNG